MKNHEKRDFTFFIFSLNNALGIFSVFSVFQVEITHFSTPVCWESAKNDIFRFIKLARTCYTQGPGTVTFLGVVDFVNEKCKKAVHKFTGTFKSTFYVQNVLITPL